jgi:hypothetical protein
MKMAGTASRSGAGLRRVLGRRPVVLWWISAIACCGSMQRSKNDGWSFEPEFRNRSGSAPAPGAGFRALAENPDAQKGFKRSGQRHAHPATPEAGVLPSTENFGQGLHPGMQKYILTPAENK